MAGGQPLDLIGGDGGLGRDGGEVDGLGGRAVQGAAGVGRQGELDVDVRSIGDGQAALLGRTVAVLAGPQGVEPGGDGHETEITAGVRHRLGSGSSHPGHQGHGGAGDRGSAPVQNAAPDLARSQSLGGKSQE